MAQMFSFPEHSQGPGASEASVQVPSPHTPSLQVSSLDPHEADVSVSVEGSLPAGAPHLGERFLSHLGPLTASLCLGFLPSPATRTSFYLRQGRGHSHDFYTDLSLLRGALL